MFNPNDHLMQLKSKEGTKDYLPVQWRLVWFREQYPQGTIDTEEIMIDLDREVEAETRVWSKEKNRYELVVKRAKGYARFKAIVTDGQGGRATGTKSENAASFPDYIEKAETGAIGRALAALGYGTQFAPDLNEGERIVDAPVEQHAAPSPKTGVVSAPDVRALRKRAATLFPSTPWDQLIAKIFNGEIIPDDNLTPEDRARIARNFDTFEARRSQKVAV